MKRIYAIAVAAILALLAISCNKETQETAYLTEFPASIEDFSTKTTLNVADLKTSWTKGDKIIVHNGQTYATFIWDADKQMFTTSATQFAATGDYLAVYPASIVDKNSTSLESISVTLPSSQSYSTDEITSLPLVAEAGNSKGFVFKNLCAVVRIQLPADAMEGGKLVSSATIECEGTNLSGAATVSRADASMTVSEAGDNKKLTVNCKTPVEASKPIYAYIPAQTYKGGMSLKVTASDGSIIGFGTDKSFSIAAGVIDGVSMVKEALVFSGGEGTKEDPYQIKRKSDLADLVSFTNDETLAKDYADKYYVQTADIEAGEMSPISQLSDQPFTGSYDAKGYKITGLKIANTKAAAAGLFGYVSGGTVANVTLEDADIDSEAAFCGGIAGQVLSGATISNCTVGGQVRAYKSGNSVAASDYAVVTTANAGYNGGIAGLVSNSTVSNCTLTGKATFYGKFSGGIVGVSHNSAIENCSVPKEVPVNVYYHYCGGIAGRARGEKNVIKGCSFEGLFTTVGYAAGGIVGQLLGGTVEDCVLGSYAYFGSDKFAVGGIAGSVQPEAAITINRCAAYGTIRAAYSVGGIAGYVGGGSGASSDKDLILSSNTANKLVTISDCAMIGASVTATSGNSAYYPIAAGILGWSHTGASLHLKGCCSIPGLIQTTYGANKYGVLSGICAYQNGTAGATIENCYSAFGVNDMLVCSEQAASDESRWYAGIHIRCTQATTVKNCYSESSMRVGYSSGAATETGCGQYSITEMTNGTLLAQLQATANGTVWVAGSNGYPVAQNIPADPNVKPKGKKKISVIGDSISTFKGWIPGGYSAHYPATDGTLTLVNETYWYRLAHDYMKNAEIDVNIAFSGSTVTNTTAENYAARYGTASNAWWHNSYSERFAACGGCGNPDIILIHGGTNDWSHNADPLAPGVVIRNDASNIYGGSAPSDDIMNAIYAKTDAAKTTAEANALPDGTYCEAYAKLLTQIRIKYPKAKVVMIIGDYLSQSIEQSQLALAKHFGAKTVNLFRVNGFNDMGGYSPETLKYGEPQPHMPKHDHTDLSSAGGCHPGSQCMAFMAEKTYAELGAWLEE